MKKPAFTICIDTREQAPWCFPEGQQVVRTGLPSGDYSLLGYENVVSIERKSLDDLVGTIIHHRKRFMNELHRLSSYRRRLVAIEGNVEDILEHRYNSEAHPFSVLGSVISLQATFNTAFCFWGSRQHAEFMGLKWLEHVAARTKRWAEKEEQAKQEALQRDWEKGQA